MHIPTTPITFVSNKERKNMSSTFDYRKLNWTLSEIEKPTKDKMYLVVIRDLDTLKDSVSMCSYFVDGQRFHFDMKHINWKVIKWAETPFVFDDKDLKSLKLNYNSN